MATSARPTSVGAARRASGRCLLVRLFIVAALGVAVVPGCPRRAPRTPAAVRKSASVEPPLARWARLGEIWREMSAHLAGERGDRQTGKAAFDVLRADMLQTLDAVQASPELRVVFGERWGYVAASRYVTGTTYGPTALGAAEPALTAVEDEVEELNGLAAAKLTAAVGKAAAGRFATQIGYLARVEALRTGPSAGGPGRQSAADSRRKLSEQYEEGKITPGPAALEAGKRLVEFTVSRCGWLTEPRKDHGAPSRGGQRTQTRG